MTPEQYRRVKSIFETAADLPAAERKEYLDEACQGDVEVRREVELLLQGDALSGAILDAPAFHVMESQGSVAGSRIGPWRVVREIARGGMGAVYEAVRADEAFQQRAAIKLVRPGMDHEAVLHRFRHERQILATLEHPNIARLLDGGAAPDGRPYFVMEYVEGEPIDEYCNRRRLRLEARLKLFGDVCSAVHHAHQRLIVHRDLKPANILVTSGGTVKLLDFGIAKLLDEDHFGLAAATVTGMRLMTPEYASPEQIRGLPITTATDVYSLGVVLYELLAGRRPFRMKSRVLEEMARVICQEEPERPSTAVTAETAPQTGERSAGELRRRLAGDLDNIILTAMRKEPERRYASAEAFLEDVRRFLAGQPVRALKDTAAYRVRKFVRRNRVPVAAAFVAIAALIAGTVFSLWQARIAEARRVEADQQRQVAVARQLAAQAERILDGGNPVRGALLGIEAVQRFHTAETDHALRRSLRLLPAGLRRLRLHEGRVAALRFNPDGARLVSAGQDGRVAIVDAATGSKRAEFAPGGKPIGVGFAEDGARFAVATEDAAEMRELDSGRLLWRVSTPKTNAIVLAGNRAAIASEGKVRLLDTATGGLIAEFAAGPGPMPVLAFAGGGSALAGGSADGLLRLWSVERGTIRTVTAAVGPDAQRSGVNALAVNRDGRWMATGGQDGRAKVWDIRSGGAIAAVQHDALVTSVAISPDGRFLATGSVDETARLWRLPKGDNAAVLRHEGPVRHVAFSSDGRTLATASWDGVVRTWDVASTAEIARIAHDSRIAEMAFHPSQRLLATGDWDGSVYLWEPHAREESAVLRHASFVVDARFSPDGRWLAAAGMDGAVSLWDVQARKEAARFRHEPACTAIAFSRDGGHLAIGSGGVRGGPGAIAIRRSGDWRTVTSIRTHSTPLSLAFSPDGAHVASGLGPIVGRGEGGLFAWRVSNGEPAVAAKHPDACYGTAFNPDGKWLAGGCGPLGGGAPGLIRIVDTQAWRVEADLPRRDTVVAVAFSPDGSRLGAVGGPVTDGAGWAALLAVPGWGPVAEMPHRETVFALAFSPGGKRLATGSGSAYGSGTGQMLLWDGVSGAAMGAFAHDRTIMSVGFSPDGRRLAAASQDRTARVWDVDTRRLIATLRHDDALQTAAFHPSGAWLATSSLDGTARVWMVQPDDLIREACGRVPRALTAEEWAHYLGASERAGPACGDRGWGDGGGLRAAAR